MHLIDTHSHIYLQDYAADRKAMLERAEKEGIVKILLPAIDSSTHDIQMETEAAYPGLCACMMGLHPCSVKQDFLEELRIARQRLETGRFVAVGEIGLDLYWDKSFLANQYQAFHQQIEWALEYNLPIVIHSRDAVNECIAVVAEHQNGKLRGVFHCFSGDFVQAQKIIDLGFYLGIGGVVTFKNSGLDKVMEQVSFDHIVLETDAPYLAPVPFRGKRNEPGYLKYVVEKLSAIKNRAKEDIAAKTTSNAEKLFPRLRIDYLRKSTE